MKPLLFILFFELCSAVQVTVFQGVLKGVETKTSKNRTFYSFLGVPYAKPPTNEHRFKEPVMVSSWHGVYDASTYSSPCMQYSHSTYLTDTPVIGSEDCLYLNIYTPEIPDIPHEKLRVIVFFHGGAFTFGTGNIQGPHYLLDVSDVVLVSVNYRLGPLGFLSTGDDVVPGNNGLKDQLVALKWIKRNIGSFGGDPSKVTITGMSAGGASVHYHMLSPQSRGYFSKAVSMSGSALCPWAQAENVREKSKRLAENLGCPTTNSHTLVKCLKKRPALKIVGEMKSFMPYLFNPFSPFGPVVEPTSPTAFIDESPIDIILNKKSSDVPWLVSISSEEGLYPGAEIFAKYERMEDLENNWNQFLPYLLEYEYTIPSSKMSDVGEKIRAHYLEGKTIKENKKGFIKMISDRMYVNSIVSAVKLHAQLYSSPVYFYKFYYVGKGHVANFLMDPSIYEGAGHGDDLGYILKMLAFPEFEAEPHRSLMTPFMTSIWTNFTDTKGISWPDVKSRLPNVVLLNIQGGTEDKIFVSDHQNISDENFWISLGFKENTPSHSQHLEL